MGSSRLYCLVVSLSGVSVLEGGVLVGVSRGYTKGIRVTDKDATGLCKV